MKLVVSIAASALMLAGFATGAAYAEKEKKSARIKGTISNTQQPKAGSSATIDSELHGKIFLRADMERAPGVGMKCDVAAYYTSDEKKSIQDKLAKLMVSPLVEMRVALWKAYYSRLFEEISNGVKVPEGLREKINVTVTKNHKVMATVEWMDDSTDPQVQACANDMLKKIRSFETAPWIAFPEKSYLELISFDVYLKGTDGIQLGNGRHKLDID